MNKQILAILTLVLLLASSCKKDDLIVDREELLSDDTALFVYKAQYNSHTPTALKFNVDMIMLKGLQTETDYGNYDFVDTSYAPDQNISFTSPFNNSFASVGTYSTVLVFDYGETQSYDEEFVGFYLRRFFELADSLPNRNVALSSISAEQNTPTRFHSEIPGEIFGNSWQYNIETFYNLTSHYDDQANSASGSFLKARLMGLIDSMVASPNATGQLSITLISGYGGYNFTSSNDIDQIIDHALVNNVQMNFITPYDNFDLSRIANETGGFISTRIQDYQNNDLPLGEGFSNIQIPLQNLDKLLMNEVTTQRVSVTIIYTTTTTWQSGDQVGIQMNYNGYFVQVGLRIP